MNIFFLFFSSRADFFTEDPPFQDPTMRRKIWWPSDLHSSIQNADLDSTDLKTQNFQLKSSNNQIVNLIPNN